MSEHERGPQPIAGGASVAEPTFADVNRDVLATLRTPGNVYFAWMCVVGLILTCGILAWTYQIFYGMGAAGKRTPQMWAMYITTFVFWIGIGHAGTLISAVLYLFRPRGRSTSASARGRGRARRRSACPHARCRSRTRTW